MAKRKKIETEKDIESPIEEKVVLELYRHGRSYKMTVSPSQVPNKLLKHRDFGIKIL